MTTIGTEAYCSPECAKMMPYTKKADIWALGVVVYEMAALKRPFEAKPDKPIIYAILNSTPAPIPVQYSRYLQQFIDMLLTKDPEKRPSMEQVVEHRAIAHGSNKEGDQPIGPAVSSNTPGKTVQGSGDDATKVRPVSAPSVDNAAATAVSSNGTTTKPVHKSASSASTVAAPTAIAKPNKDVPVAADAPTIVRKPPRSVPMNSQSSPALTANLTAIQAASVPPKATSASSAPPDNAAATAIHKPVIKGATTAALTPPAKPPRAQEPTTAVQRMGATTAKPVASAPKAANLEETVKAPVVTAAPVLPTIIRPKPLISSPTTISAPPEVKAPVTAVIKPQQQPAEAPRTSVAKPARPKSSEEQTLMLRKEKFAIKPTYHRDDTLTTAPMNFTITRMPKQDVGDPLATTLSAKKSKKLEEELQQYGERTLVFQNVDKHAFAVSKTSHRTFKDLIWDLIFAQGITDEFEKARALFLWLCTKDLSKIHFVNPEPDSPEDVLMHLKNGTQQYAQVFEMMCSFSNLQCSLISGHAKGVTYKLGKKFSEENKNCGHTWCAVLVDGQWRFVDPNWGSRAMILSRSQLEYELDEFYFFPPPEHYIYTHFPYDEKWQLLEKPIKLSEFEEKLPFLTSLFFKLNLEPGHGSKHLQLSPNSDGEAVLELKQTKKSHVDGLDFTYRLRKENGDAEEVVGGTKVNLERCVYHEVDYKSKKVRFTIRPPSVGSSVYHFTVFGLPPSKIGSATIGNDGTYNAVGEWLIKPEEKLRGKLQRPFPSSWRTWGGPSPTQAAARGIAKYPVEGHLAADSNGIVEIILKKSDPSGSIHFSANLLSADPKYTEQTLSLAVLFRFTDGGSKAIFTVSLPGKGEFALQIYSSLPGGEVSKNGESISLQQLCQYLLVWRDDGKAVAKPHLTFPAINSTYLGPKPQYSNLGLKAISYPDPYILVQNWSLPLEITFESPKPLQASANLYFCSPTNNKPDEDCSRWTFQHSDVSKRREMFLIRFPRGAGMYKLELFGKSGGDGASAGIPAFYYYLINVGGDRVESGFAMPPFPKQYGQWSGGHLSEPLDGVVKRYNKSRSSETKSVKIRLAIQGALKVVAIAKCTNDWTHLELGKDGYWQGEVSLEEAWKQKGDSVLGICANFPDDNPTSYSALLDYELSSN